MTVLLLCAGFGTRLDTLTRDTPKGLLPIAGQPILDYLLPQVLDFPELRAVHVVTNGRFAAQFYAWKQRWEAALEARGVTFVLHSDGSLAEADRLGSVGDLHFALRRIGTADPTVVAADDTIFRFPLRPVAERFLASGEHVLLAMPEPNYQLRQRLTILELDAEDRVRRLHKNPEAPPTEWAAPVLYFLHPRALGEVEAYLEQEGAERDSLAHFLDHLAATQTIRAVRYPAAESRTWFDVETRYMYRRADEVLAEESLMLALPASAEPYREP